MWTLSTSDRHHRDVSVANSQDLKPCPQLLRHKVTIRIGTVLTALVLFGGLFTTWGSEHTANAATSPMNMGARTKTTESAQSKL
jgi:hypothetical protein